LLGQQPKNAEASRKEVFSHLSAHPDLIPTDMLENDLAAGALPGALDTSVQVVRWLISPLAGTRAHVMLGKEFNRLATPTLFVWGSRDNFQKPDEIRDVLLSAPSVRLQVLNDAGHILTLEQPDAVAESIRQFLSE
jgi:pimeloyl-ACP methyl ester carboxylesterase